MGGSGPRRAPDVQRLPLLERLAQDGHGDALDFDGLRASIARELARLLNVRSVAPLSGRPMGVLDYGLPDPSSLYAANAEDRTALARAIERAILAFEPRLLAPRAELLPAADARVLLAVVSGAVRIDGGLRPARYGLRFKPDGAAVSALEDA